VETARGRAFVKYSVWRVLCLRVELWGWLVGVFAPG
jgi:hypothetical protein